MNAPQANQQRVCATRRAVIALGGLRPLSHPKLPASVPVTLFRWEQVQLSGQTAKLIDPNGRQVRRGLLPLEIPLDRRQRRAARRARHRYMRRGLRQRTLRFVQHHPRYRWRQIGAVVLLTALVASLFVFAALWLRQVAHSTIPLLQEMSRADAALAIICVLLTMLMLGLYCIPVLVMGLREVFCSTETVRVDGHGVHIKHQDGREERGSWSDLTAVRYAAPHYILTFRGGTSLKVPVGAGKAIILHEWERLDPARFAKQRRLFGSPLIRTILCFQAAAVILGVLAIFNPGLRSEPNVIGPAICLGVVVPAALVLHAVVSRRTQLARKRPPCGFLPERQQGTQTSC